MDRLVLCILDGWGIGDEADYNAIHMANTPVFDKLISTYPHAQILTSGENVGLPHGQMGNSEVGHMTIGAGRVLLQDLPKISKAFSESSFFAQPLMQNLKIQLLKTEATLHLIGLASDGGVHSHIDHIIIMAKHFQDAGIKVQIHAITDGRDTEPNTAKKFIKTLQSAGMEIATISGRYYAMDRDMRLDRTAIALEAIANANAPIFDSEFSILDSESDEFILPHKASSYNGFAENDAIICTNFRADRMRQICTLISESKMHFTSLMMMTSYSDHLEKKFQTIFKKEKPSNTLGEIISAHNLKQLRAAETEKYAHVTYFLNCGHEAPFKGEDRLLCNSPQVATYDLKPEMSAQELTKKLCSAIAQSKYDFICVNYANTDMVGHSGNLAPTILAVEAVDNALGELVEACTRHGYEMLITADHGNAEDIRITSHTLNSVPIIYLSNTNHTLDNGTLADIAPTVLSILGIEKPADMTGKTLIKIDC